MLRTILERRDTGDQGTFGKMILPDFGKWYYSVELPWLENKSRVSCVPSMEWLISHGFCMPEGEYTVVMRRSPKFGWVYWLKDVPLRDFCLIHPANFGGNKAKGFHTHLEGCIGLGFNLGWIDRQKAILRSRPAVTEFMNTMEREPFLLKVVNTFDEVKSK